MNGTNPALSKPGLFYGWLVVAAAFAVTLVGFGSAHTFSASVEPLQTEFAASRGSVSLVFSLAGFLYFGLGIVSGPLADRWGSASSTADGSQCFPAIVLDQFGGRNVSGIIGVLYTSVAFGTLIGPSAAGFAFDLSHSHTLPVVAGACANVIAAAIVVGTLKELMPHMRKPA